MTLELLTTISVALVAVGIGFRLVFGDLDLATGLAVLVLAPEVYLPLRQVGAHFHASADGVAAAEQAFAVLEEPAPRTGHRAAPDLGRTHGAPARRRGRGAGPCARSPPPTSTSSSRPVRWSRSPGRTVPASRPPSRCCSACSTPDAR